MSGDGGMMDGRHRMPMSWDYSGDDDGCVSHANVVDAHRMAMSSAQGARRLDDLVAWPSNGTLKHYGADLGGVAEGAGGHMVDASQGDMGCPAHLAHERPGDVPEAQHVPARGMPGRHTPVSPPPLSHPSAQCHDDQEDVHDHHHDHHHENLMPSPHANAHANQHYNQHPHLHPHAHRGGDEHEMGPPYGYALMQHVHGAHSMHGMGGMGPMGRMVPMHMDARMPGDVRMMRMAGHSAHAHMHSMAGPGMMPGLMPGMMPGMPGRRMDISFLTGAGAAGQNAEAARRAAYVHAPPPPCSDLLDVDAR